jgi:hypothetical protein
MRRLGSIAALTLLLLAGCSSGHSPSVPAASPDEAKFVADVQAADAVAGVEFQRDQALQVGYAFCQAMAVKQLPGGSAAWIAASGLQDVPEAAAAVHAAGDLCPSEHLQ